MEYKKLRRGKTNQTYDIDNLDWHIEKYQQRTDRKIKAIVINNKPLTKRDKVKYRCTNCGKEVELFADKLVKRNGEKLCRECAIVIYRRRHPDWLILSEEQRKAISERNSGPKITEAETRVCPNCGKEFEIRLTARNKNQIYCNKECNIKNWADYGSINGGAYAHLGIKALLGRDTKPEIRMKEILEEKHIRYKFQKVTEIHNGKKRVFDFYLLDYNTYIEVDGDYWHYNINNVKVAKKPPNKKQLAKMQHDQEKNEYCRINNINLIRIWASELEERAELILSSFESVLE